MRTYINHVTSKSQDYGDIIAQNATRAPNDMQKLKIIKNLKTTGLRNVFSWRLKVLMESMRRSGDGSLFHARGAATANERSPSDDVVRGTATEPDVADLRPALAVVRQTE